MIINNEDQHSYTLINLLPFTIVQKIRFIPMFSQGAMPLKHNFHDKDNIFYKIND